MTRLFLASVLAAVLLPAAATAEPCAATSAAVASSEAPAAARLSADQQREVVTRLADLLETRYLDIPTGRRYAERLRAQLACGAYAALTDPTALGEQVTADLQAIAPDRHLRLAPQGAGVGKPRAAGELPQSAQATGPDGLEDARMIGDVAYLRFNMFPADPTSGDAARAFLLAHADARAVIIDARPLRGGGEVVMDALLPLFYAQPTKLLRLDMRASGPDDDGEPTPAMVRQTAPAGIIRLDHQVTPDAAETRLRAAPLYYLTSRRTASAGEHMALALKRTGRGVLVGETTMGAGHFGWIEALPHGFRAFIPTGRTYDPDTGFDWEGRGVTPDVAVPADAALDEALARIARTGPSHP
jgi:hypothetical protein